VLGARVRQIFDKRADPMPGFKSDFCGAHTSKYIVDAFVISTPAGSAPEIRAFASGRSPRTERS
jgi:hypothetical protein